MSTEPSSDPTSHADSRVPLPAQLYRGDSDPAGIRQLRMTWGDGCLLTNLANGGSGREIFMAPLSRGVRRHVASDWKTTHFLSFTTSRERAFEFAAGAGRALKDLIATEDRERWDTAVMTVDTRIFRSSEVERGIYHCTYPGWVAVRHDSRVSHDHAIDFREMYRAISNGPREGQLVKVLLIDVVAYLERLMSEELSVGDQLRNARRDREWLVLPMDPFEERGEYTAKLDDACVSMFERFRFR